MVAHRERIEAVWRQAHFEWEQRQMHQAAAQYKYAVEQDATAHTARPSPLISGYTPTKPPVYGKDGFKERDQQKFVKRFIVYARGQDAISEIKFNVSKFWSHVRGVLSNVLPAMAAEANALHAKGISNKERAEAVPTSATVLAAEVKRLQDNAKLTAAEVKSLTLEARTRPACGGWGGNGCDSILRPPDPLVDRAKASCGNGDVAKPKTVLAISHPEVV
ncbi:hypothetical protein DYB28_006274 [Aphanomyces astaci]|uniref:Uncharacterized protein n=1 Tax=Aphanomyces astaci TaxID=112090 RepID=A0A9X8HEG7_APHAT|nr:hypothetical protein DYB28_006274 [Aphanomyces astaci]